MDEIGLLGFDNSKDLFYKLKRDFSRLQSAECSDNYMNFIFVANHLREWIENDMSLPEDFKLNAKDLIEESNYNIFNNMANRGKHHITTKKQRVYTKDEVTSGFSLEEFSWDNFSWDIRKYIVEVNENQLDLFNECQKIYDTYCNIFEG